ncbi:unnamed protein product [Rotaria sp. Silwood2]|nr:unnamed protein product [Rotaria sp. Silwood2]CAF2989094.1 unnamed protein product [Rotaria sp. Silwood2]CAF3213161.1 unnamed protein product [Rotaria sp. Silwood2]CAF4070248.1 unnamed protein product [Rotaria sp. Silwood2]CAF4104476.1 unnamed protein product [Rotaria sp. Silwood2]
MFDDNKYQNRSTLSTSCVIPEERRASIIDASIGDPYARVSQQHYDDDLPASGIESRTPGSPLNSGIVGQNIPHCHQRSAETSASSESVDMLLKAVRTLSSDD